MTFLYICVCFMYALAVFFDIVFMKTGNFMFKYAYWTSMFLAIVGNGSSIVINYKKKRKAHNSKTKDDSES